MQDANKQNEDDLRRKKKELERDIVMREDERKKLIEKKIQTEAEIRALKKSESSIKVSLQEKGEQMKKDDDEIMRADVEIQGMKKKLNLM